MCYQTNRTEEGIILGVPVHILGLLSYLYSQRPGSVTSTHSRSQDERNQINCVPSQEEMYKKAFERLIEGIVVAKVERSELDKNPMCKNLKQIKQVMDPLRGEFSPAKGCIEEPEIVTLWRLD